MVWQLPLEWGRVQRASWLQRGSLQGGQGVSNWYGYPFLTPTDCILLRLLHIRWLHRPSARQQASDHRGSRTSEGQRWDQNLKCELQSESLFINRTREDAKWSNHHSSRMKFCINYWIITDWSHFRSHPRSLLPRRYCTRDCARRVGIRIRWSRSQDGREARKCTASLFQIIHLFLSRIREFLPASANWKIAWELNERGKQHFFRNPSLAWWRIWEETQRCLAGWRWG